MTSGLEKPKNYLGVEPKSLKNFLRDITKAKYLKMGIAELLKVLDVCKGICWIENVLIPIHRVKFFGSCKMLLKTFGV